MTSAQLRSQLQLVLDKHPEARLVGFLASAPYSGGAELSVGQRSFEICAARSPLEVHELAARSDEDHSLHLAFLWGGDEHLVSQDVLQRLPGQRLRHPDPWDAVRQAFRATSVDPRLRQQPLLAHYLVESEPAAGYPAAASGILTAELAWEQLLEHRLGLHPDTHEPRLLLRWAVESDTRKAAGAPDDLLALTREWLRERGGELLDYLFPLLIGQNPHDAVSLGVVVDCLYAHEHSAALVARARAERLWQNRALPAALARQWSELTRDLFQHLDPPDPSWVHAALERAGQIISELQAGELAEWSALLPQAFDAELVRLCQALMLGDLARGEQSLAVLNAHHFARRRREDLDQAEMALRLLRWLQSPEPATRPELAWWAQDYAQRLCFVDWARSRLVGATPLAYAHLSRLAQDRRDASNRGFADALASWHRAGASCQEVLLGEELLGTVAAPLSNNSRVLLLLLDGCSLACLRELTPSLANEGWSPYRPTDERWERLLAGLPSVTSVSRTTLLTGQLQSGNQTTEKAAFGPTLFHKGDLGGDRVTDAILGDAPLVAVVINSIDDTLAKEEQLNLAWTQRLIRPLDTHLRSAMITGRVVLLVSDHGHVLDFGTHQRSGSTGGARYQEGNTANAGEVVLAGGRVRLSPSVRMLWTEKERFGGRQRGYHGGASPQEMLCSLALFAPTGRQFAGWREGQMPSPAWWESSATERDLFGNEQQEDVWSQLLRHPALELKKTPADLGLLVNALARAGGKMELSRLAASLGQTPQRLHASLHSRQGTRGWLRLLKIGTRPLLLLSSDGEWLTLDLKALPR